MLVKAQEQERLQKLVMQNVRWLLVEEAQALLVEEAQALWNARYPVPPDVRFRFGWVLSIDGIPVLSVPTGMACTATIYNHYWSVLMPEEHNDPQWHPDNRHMWAFFAQRHEFVDAWSAVEYWCEEAERSPPRLRHRPRRRRRRGWPIGYSKKL